MWKKTWLLGILMAATALSGSGCSCGDGGTTGPDGGNTTVDGGQDGGGGSLPDGGGDPNDPGDGGVALTGLSISPTTVTLNASSKATAAQKFTVTGTYADLRTEDVTNQAVFSVDDTRLGSFEGSNFVTATGSAAVGGISTVRARIGTMSVSAALTVKLQQNTSDSASGSSSLPPQPEDKFGGTVDNTTRKPQILYPNSGVMVPPNLGQLEFHFNPGPSTNTLFQLSFTNAITDVRVHLRCYLPAGLTPTLPTGATRGCIYTPSAEVWKFLAESNRGGQPVQVTLKATGDSGGTVGVSDPILLNFARSEIKGALYYWTTSGGTAVKRYDFAGPGSQEASSVLTSGDIKPIGDAVRCVGCHALSRNGKKMVAEVNGQYDGRLALVDLATFTPGGPAEVDLAQSGSKLSNFEAWNPDGSKFAGVYFDHDNASGYGVLLFSGTNAQFEKMIPGTGTSTSPANHPDWSSDGKTIAYTRVGIRNTNQRSYKGAIHMVTAQTGDTWNSPVTVVAAASGKNRYYPAIAPDNSFLVYNESTCPTGVESDTHCNGDTDPTAMLWAAKLQANATPVPLTRANAPGINDKGVTSLTNSYPKWSPFVTRGNGSDTSKLMWVTFSSSRNYGLRSPPAGDSSPDAENNKGTLLWMAAVDPDKVTAGQDPSYPAFALPFQELNTSNHIAQWAEYLVSNGCSTVDEGCGSGGSTCCNGLQCVQLNQDPPVPCSVNGACVCKPIPQCAPAFEKCSTAAPCCDGNRCLDANDNDCQGGDCSCKPPCSGSGQPCGGANACCDGLKCSTSASGNVCKVVIN